MKGTKLRDSPPMEPQKDPWAFLHHPVLGALGIVASVTTIIGVGLSIYFYKASQNYPEIVNRVHPVRAAILRHEEASKLSATFEARELRGDVTAAQIGIWNEGTRAVKQGEISTTDHHIRFATEPRVNILETRLRKTSRDEVECSLDDSDLQNGTVGVTWKILENDDGCIF